MTDESFTPEPVAGTPAPPAVSGNPPGNTPVPVPRGTVDHFCAALSATDKRVELIGAFHNAELAAKRPADTHDNYQTRFGAFAAQPA